MEAGYDPARVGDLSRRTAEAIEVLARIGSDDPAAADAMRIVRLTRRNLQDHWMPALRDIEQTSAMISWTRSELRRTTPVYSNAELLGELDWLDRRYRGATTATDARLDETARQLALRVSHNPRFGDLLLARSTTTPLIAELTGRAAFPIEFVSQLVRTMMWPHGPSATADLDAFASALDVALASMTVQPAACLDLLLDPQVLYGVAAWQRLDSQVLAGFVTAGLYEAVVDDPARLADGFEVLRTLTTITNGPLDDGIHRGVALGVSVSLARYIDSLAPAIRQEGSTPVVVRTGAVHLELGTYDELVDLFGALLRDPAAQVALGAVLGAYTSATVDSLGTALLERPGLQYVARFADLLGDASRNEQAELVAEAATEAARRQQFGGLISLAVTATMTASGVGTPARGLAEQAIGAATNWAARVDAVRLSSAAIPARTYDLITVVVLRSLAASPQVRQSGDFANVAPTQWRELHRRLERIEREHDAHRRTILIGDLDHWIESAVPALAAHLIAVRSLPGLDELIQGRNAVNPD